jgi:thymidylate kinase
MDAPQIERMVAEDRRNGLINRLIDLEKSWYRYIAPPDILIVLRVDPEIAVRRKTDEREDHVRTRSTEVWQADWSQTKAHVVDAAQAKEKVLADIKSFIWSQL